MSGYKFTLWLTKEAADTLKHIPRGEKSGYICDALAAYSRKNEANQSKDNEIASSLRELVGEIRGISSKLNNVSVVSGTSQEPSEQPENTGQKLNVKEFMMKHIHY